MYYPSPLPMSLSRPSSQYSSRSEYIMIHTGAQVRSSLSGLNLATQSLRYSPTELETSGPSSMILYLSSRHKKITVKNPFSPSCNVTWPLGFHLAAIQPYRAFSVGQNPINFPMSAWCFMYWIHSLILWPGNSILGLLFAIGLQVFEVTLGISFRLSFLSGVSLLLSVWLADVLGLFCCGISLLFASSWTDPNTKDPVCPSSAILAMGEDAPPRGVSMFSVVMPVVLCRNQEVRPSVDAVTSQSPPSQKVARTLDAELHQRAHHIIPYFFIYSLVNK